MNDFIDTHRYLVYEVCRSELLLATCMFWNTSNLLSKFWSFNLSSFFHLELFDIDLQFLSQTDRILNPDSMRQTRLLVIVFRSMQVSEVERESREREEEF